MDFLPDEKIKCHHTAFRESCREMVTKCSCRKWVQILGNNPNTSEPINRWGCVDSWMPLLLIENSQMQRQTGAAVESLRNEVVQANERQTMLQIQQLRQLRQQPKQDSAELRALPVQPTPH